MIETRRFSRESDWLEALTADFRKVVDQGIAARGTAHIALSGGSTPRPFYLALNRSGLPRDRITWWLGDERWVPPTDDASNEKMIRESLGAGHADFADRFRSWHPAADPAQAALRYETQLRREIGAPPVFDLILLGIGTDGHTASLFPDTAALSETTRCAIAHDVPQMRSTRLTLTFPALDRARRIWFLVRGKDKAAILNSLSANPQDFPAGRIRSASQELYWLDS